MKRTISLLGALSLSAQVLAVPVTSADMTITNQTVGSENRANFITQAFSISNTTCSSRQWVSGQGMVNVPAPCKYTFSWQESNNTTGSNPDINMYIINDANNNGVVDAGDSVEKNRSTLNGYFGGPKQALDNGNYIALMSIGNIGNPWLTTKFDDFLITPYGTGVSNLGSISGSLTIDVPTGWQANNGTSDLVLRSVDVPEPSSFALLGLSITGLTLLRRRKSHI